MNEAPVLLRQGPADGVLRLRLNRPQARNAINLPLRQELAKAFTDAASDASVRVVIIGGGPDVFAAGADIRDMAEASPVEMHRRAYHRYWQPIADFPKPVIAQVSGFALGAGFELALHADIIVASSSARFGFPEIKVGIMPGAGGTQRLVRVIGKFRAMRLLMGGEFISAELAERWGLVSTLVPPEDLEPHVGELAGRLARGPATALQQIKEAVLLGADLPLSSALALERKSMQMLFGSADQREGMAAFLEKRDPMFRGE